MKIAKKKFKVKAIVGDYWKLVLKFTEPRSSGSEKYTLLRKYSKEKGGSK